MLHHTFHMRVDFPILGVAVLDVVCSLVNLSDLVLNFRAAMNQQFIGSMEEIRLAAFLRKAYDFEELFQFNDSKFCQISLCVQKEQTFHPCICTSKSLSFETQDGPFNHFL